MEMIKKVTHFVLYTLRKKIHSFRTNEGGITIRKTRLKQFKKKSKGLVIVVQIVAIWYIMIFTGSYLTTDTGAYFNDVEVIENSFQAGKLDEPKDPVDDGIWGKSSLKEVSIRGTCEEGIYGRFTNTGESVNHELTKYEVYWSETGDPKDGTVVETGSFPIPNKGEFYDIYYKPLKNGKYTIKAYHEAGHSNSNGEGKGPWSGEITITGCAAPPLNENDPKPQPPVTNQTLGEVTDVSWNIKGNSGKVTINWKNPAGEFSHVNVYIDGQTSLLKENIIDQILDLDIESPTTYRISTVDKSGKESAGIKLTVSKTSVTIN
jgi:YqxM protein